MGMKEILTTLLKDGFERFLSLEPHLFDFQGFDQLETGPQKKASATARKLTGEEAFTLAYQSLMELFA